MAILEKIRKRSIILILVIGLALFAFVISGVIDGGGLKKNPKSVIGKVNGEPISREVFVNAVERASRNYGGSVSTLQVVNQIWNQQVRRKVMEEQFEALGIHIGKDQIISIIKSNPAFARDSTFLNEAGVFDEKKFITFIAELKTNRPGGYEQWKLQEKELINSAKEQTYFNLIKAGINSTLEEGKLSYTSEHNKLTFKYVHIPYATVPDSTVTISDDDIKAYANAHEEDFKTTPLRALQYVYFEEKASPDDEKEIKTGVMELLEQRTVYDASIKDNTIIAGLRTTKNIEDFVNSNSDIPFDSAFVAKKDLPVVYADSIFNLRIGEVYGPYKDGNYLKISKMLAKKNGGSVKASHILIAYQGAERAAPTITRTKNDAASKANSLAKEAIKNPETFAQMARDNSDGPSASRGGDLGYFSAGNMVKPFNDFAFNNPVGTIGVVETTFGFHVIKIEAIEDVVQIADVAREIVPSEETINTVFRDATTFEIAVSDKDFTEVAKENNYPVRPVRNLEPLDETIAGIGNQRNIVQWAFDEATEIGAVKRFNNNGGYVIAQLTGKTKEGVVTNEIINTKIRPVLKKQKKLEILMKKYEGKSMQELADEGNTTIRTVSDITMKKLTISGVGREPKVIGVAFALKKGNTSELIQGENGIYMIEVVEKETAPPLDNYSTYANTQKTTQRSGVNVSVYNALKETAKIIDNRSDFY